METFVPLLVQYLFQHFKVETLSKYPQTMNTLRVAALALSVTISIAAAASYAPYFYTTESVPTAVVECEDQVSHSSFQIACAAKCARLRCDRFRWSNGTCNMRMRNTPPSSGKHTFRYKKVSLIYQITFSFQIYHRILQKKYLLIKQKKKFPDSLAHCQSLGGTLALPESAEENQMLQQEIGESPKTPLCSPLFFCTYELCDILCCHHSLHNLLLLTFPF